MKIINKPAYFINESGDIVNGIHVGDIDGPGGNPLGVSIFTLASTQEDVQVATSVYTIVHIEESKENIFLTKKIRYI